MRRLLQLLIVLLLAAIGFADIAIRASASGQKNRITVRTERFPRPPYSGATYYIYERNGEVVCTKLQVCNKYGQCGTDYYKGVYKDEFDAQAGDPYGKTDAVTIPAAKLRKHICLTRFKLL